MARIFTEGFETGAGLQGLTGYADVNNYQIVADAKSWGKGTYCARIFGTGNAPSLGTSVKYAYKTFATSSEIYTRFSIKLATTETTTFFIIPFRDASGNVIGGIVRTTGSAISHPLRAYKSTGTDLGALTTLDGGWHTFEVHLQNTSGAYAMDVKIDGSTYLTYADTSPVGAANIAQIRFNQEGTSLSAMDIKFDDIAINDTTGGVDDDWIGEGTVVALIPNGNGDLSELTGSDADQTDNYLLVDEIPSNSDTDYVRADINDITDLYDVSSPSLASGESYARVWIVAYARKEGVSGLNYQTTMKNGSTVTNNATAPAQTTSYAFAASEERIVNPDTSVAWTETDIQDIQIGVKVVAT